MMAVCRHVVYLPFFMLLLLIAFLPTRHDADDYARAAALFFSMRHDAMPARAFDDTLSRRFCRQPRDALIL